MTPAEAQVLISMCAAVDNRKPDADAARAWAALLDGLRFEDCRDAAVQHLRTSSEWLTPAIIQAAVRRIRAKRIEEHPVLTPPPGLDDESERRWLVNARWRIGNGEVIDCDAAYGELVTGDAVNFRALMPAPDAPARAETGPVSDYSAGTDSETTEAAKGAGTPVDTSTNTRQENRMTAEPKIHAEIHATIDAEFANAYAKHVGRTPRSWSVGDQQSLVILVEEVGEVARAMTYDEGNDDRLYDELIQVATMAACWAERIGIRGDA